MIHWGTDLKKRFWLDLFAWMYIARHSSSYALTSSINYWQLKLTYHVWRIITHPDHTLHQVFGTHALILRNWSDIVLQLSHFQRSLDAATCTYLLDEDFPHATFHVCLHLSLQLILFMDRLASPRMARHSIFTHNTQKILTPWLPLPTVSSPYIINISPSTAPTRPKVGHNIGNYPINLLETFRASSWAWRMDRIPCIMPLTWLGLM